MFFLLEDGLSLIKVIYCFLIKLNTKPVQNELV